MVSEPTWFHVDTIDFRVQEPRTMIQPSPKINASFSPKIRAPSRAPFLCLRRQGFINSKKHEQRYTEDNIVNTSQTKKAFQGTLVQTSQICCETTVIVFARHAQGLITYHFKNLNSTNLIYKYIHIEVCVQFAKYIILYIIFLFHMYIYIYMYSLPTNLSHQTYVTHGVRHRAFVSTLGRRKR